MTEPEPPPAFRRFPWVQLVFCIACLSMAAWVWAQHSYAWPVAPADLVRLRTPPRDRDAWIGPVEVPTSLVGTYVVLRGVFVRSKGPATPALQGLKDTACIAAVVRGGVVRPSWEWAWVLCPEGTNTTPGRECRIFGRVDTDLIDFWGGAAGEYPIVDGTRSRLTGESVAGLVVAAQGALVFGLYLTRWLRGRKALAEKPGRHVTA